MSTETAFWGIGEINDGDALPDYHASEFFDVTATVKHRNEIIDAALRSEQQARANRCIEYVHRGIARIEQNCEPETITLIIEGERFTDPRLHWPTIEIMARIELAVASGRSERHLIKDDHGADAMSYAIAGNHAWYSRKKILR